MVRKHLLECEFRSKVSQEVVTFNENDPRLSYSHQTRLIRPFVLIFKILRLYMAFLCFLSFGVPEFCFVNQFLMGSFLDLFFLCYGCIMPRKLECSSAKEFHVLAYYSVLKFLDAFDLFWDVFTLSYYRPLKLQPPRYFYSYASSYHHLKEAARCFFQVILTNLRCVFGWVSL